MAGEANRRVVTDDDLDNAEDLDYFHEYLDSLEDEDELDLDEIRARYRERRREHLTAERDLASERQRADTYKVIVIIVAVLFGAWLIVQFDDSGSGSVACADDDCYVQDPNDQWDFPARSRP